MAPKNCIEFLSLKTTCFALNFQFVFCWKINVTFRLVTPFGEVWIRENLGESLVQNANLYRCILADGCHPLKVNLARVAIGQTGATCRYDGISWIVSPICILCYLYTPFSNKFYDNYKMSNSFQFHNWIHTEPLNHGYFFSKLPFVLFALHIQREISCTIWQFFWHWYGLT